MTLEEALARLRAAPAAERRVALEVIGEQGDVRITVPVAACLHDPDPALVELAEATLWRVWSRSGNAVVDALFRDGLRAMQTQDWMSAISTFTRVVEAAPLFAEGWNKRATVRYFVEHYASAITDCEEVVRLNPYHFGALAGQGLCHAALRQHAAALRCFRRALEIHPRVEGVRDHLARAHQELVRGNGH